MKLGNIALAASKPFITVWLLGLVLVAYATWQAQQHMQKSLAKQVLSATAQKAILNPAKPVLPFTDAFLAGALADEAASPPTPIKPDEEGAALKLNKADEARLANALEDKPLVKSEPTWPMAYQSQTKQVGHRKKPLNALVQSPSLQLIINKTARHADARLEQAYQAYYAGDDASAQAHYQQVLADDSVNVDAMLGMAAIAQRQGRQMDAAAWYQSVLELAPENPLALLASLPMQDKAHAESRIKVLLQQQPDAPYLHAALANLYAEQGFWQAAETGFFNASQLDPNHAEYAFNLAVSLERMGKTQLALQQYERALVLLKPSASDSLIRDALILRMQQLE